MEKNLSTLNRMQHLGIYAADIRIDNVHHLPATQPSAWEHLDLIRCSQVVYFTAILWLQNSFPRSCVGMHI